MASVGLLYYLPRTRYGESLTDGDLERVAEISSNLVEARREIEELYPTVNLLLALNTTPSIPTYNICLSGERDTITQAAETLIRSVGTPSFVTGGYKVANEALEPYDKITRRRFLGVFDGKHVVDTR